MTPIPQSTVDRARRLAEVHALQDVARIIGVHPSQITKMKKLGWKAADYSCRRRARPGDFGIMAHRLTFAALARHYKAGNATIARWLRELPHPPRNRRGDALRKDPKTGLRRYQSQMK